MCSFRNKPWYSRDGSVQKLEVPCEKGRVVRDYLLPWKKLIVCYNKCREIPDVGPSALSATLLVIEGKAGLPKLAFFRYMDKKLST